MCGEPGEAHGRPGKAGPMYSDLKAQQSSGEGMRSSEGTVHRGTSRETG